ncbi:MAG: DNA translocase FtsK [Deltaproteobacteria bacterium ADurb.Bin510]|nr:MAG: DNA translocase FtsK [Deltaproteobacteria bacterium ADurb.Bin510]
MSKKKLETQSLIALRLGGIGVASLAAFILLALISFRPGDPSWSMATRATAVANWMGRIGAYVADGLFILFGLSAYLIPLFLGLLAVRLIRRQRPDWLKALSATVVFVVSMSFLGAVAPLAGFYESHSLAGALGRLIGQGLTTYLNTGGAVILLLTLLVAGLMVGFDLAGLLARVRFMYGLLRERIEDAKRLRVEKSAQRPQRVERPEQPRSEKPGRRPLPVERKSEPQITINTSKPREEAFVQQAKLDFDGGYQLPPVSLISEAKQSTEPVSAKELKANAVLITDKLADFGVLGEIHEIKPGPVITMYEFTPAPGIKISKIVGLSDDLAMALKADSVRVVAPLPGKNAVGIEIPNRSREIVGLRKILSSPAFAASTAPLPLALGADTEGDPVAVDLTRMPHLLIAGATGMGKSVGLNTMIISLLYRCTPSELKFIMIDPKRIELSYYEDIPHLIHPVVTDPLEAVPILKWAVAEMELRYELFKAFGVKGIDTYNKKVKKIEPEAVTGLAAVKTGDERPVLLPRMVIIVDEFADLMMVNKEVEGYMARLAQMARAAGMHLIVATQRPSVDVITGLIKANFPSRISFKVFSKTDSRTILDASGADQLLGMGDMLLLSPGAGLKRVHGAYVAEEELEKVVAFVKEQQSPDYIDGIEEHIARQAEFDLGGGFGGSGSGGEGAIYDQAVDFVAGKGLASISLIQRQFAIGYNKAAKIIEQMEADGIIGPPEKAGKPRKVLVKSYAEMED